MLNSSESIRDESLDSPDFNAARTDEIAVVCHELRNSLAVIRGAARLLGSSADAGALKTTRSLIERQVDQMTRHIDDLVNPRHNGQSRGLQLADIDLRTIARHAIGAIGPEIARRGHRLAVTLPDKPVLTHADGSRLEQAISNLLLNAAKYTPRGGDIALRMETDAAQVTIRIRDSGMGIEPAMLQRIFDLFVQVDSDLPAAVSGSGIGLAVVASVVKLHGGTVKATSPGLGLGSEFTILLPNLRDS